ncbi:hypothetical protein SBA1_1100015 [Candidatus Sulfotelmatobacter kueseliae]|uniref:Uncharacterized protein n=1 Tax=Candidatus Sulfotelmatobacter kueseliae TaxID=2042962 RepID=A0A2U3K076_9BACT|nr:hypothetical protein SBA1_1100015 [Candidatus Sulfotelmatobacter kueseliae]
MFSFYPTPSSPSVNDPTVSCDFDHTIRQAGWQLGNQVTFSCYFRDLTAEFAGGLCFQGAFGRGFCLKSRHQQGLAAQPS